MITTAAALRAKQLAIAGDFESAICSLEGSWVDLGAEPIRNGESDREFARLLLACGILTVEMGRLRAFPVQTKAKDLLSRAIRLFGEDPESSEALLWLGHAYLWCGENNEALAITDSILTSQTAGCYVVFSAGLVNGLAHFYLGNLDRSERAFASVEIFLPAVTPLSRGKFYLNRGMLYRQTGRLDMAMADYALAADCFRSAGSPRYQAATQNNLSRIYADLGCFAEAHTSALSALSLFREIQDRGHEAKVWDEIAQIYAREENYVEMERCASRAVEILSESDHEGWLAEALITFGTARARLGISQAQDALARALAICERQGDPRQAGAATSAMWAIVRRGKETQGEMRDDLKSIERIVYERVLESHDGHLSPAAHELGYKHQAFHKRLKNHFPELLKNLLPPRRRSRSLIKQI